MMFVTDLLNRKVEIYRENGIDEIRVKYNQIDLDYFDEETSEG
jgi:hypothetical protein